MDDVGSRPEATRTGPEPAELQTTHNAVIDATRATQRSNPPPPQKRQNYFVLEIERSLPFCGAAIASLSSQLKSSSSLTCLTTCHAAISARSVGSKLSKHRMLGADKVC